jgi:hypothetical protein
MAIMLADVTAEIISTGNLTYRNLWTPTDAPYDFTFRVDRVVFETVLQYVRSIDNDADLVTLARSVDITTSLVPEILVQAKTCHFSMDLLHAGAMVAIVVSMLRTLTTPNPPLDELFAQH